MKKTLLFCFILLTISYWGYSQTTITQWTFEGDVLTPSTGSGTAVNIGSTSSAFATGFGGGRAWNTSAYPAQSTNSATAGVEFMVSTLGYTDIAVNWYQRASGTASRWAMLYYTTDGTTWVPFENNSGGLSPHDTFYYFEVDLSSIPAANNNANFGVRIVSFFSPLAFNQNSTLSYGPDEAYMRANTDAKYPPDPGSGTGNYGTAGTWRFDNVTFIGTVAGGLLDPPLLTPDITNNNVDNNIDITFTDDPVWRSEVTAVKVNGSVLTVITDYLLTAGNLQLIPSGGNPLLTTAGSKNVSIEATGYSVAAVVQQIDAGAVTAGSTASIDNPLVPGATSTIACTAKDQYNNPVPGYSFVFDLTVTDNNATTDESYTIDGIPYKNSAANVGLESVTDANGVVTFSVVMPVTIDGGDGLAIQVQLADGTTDIGPEFSYFNLPPTVTLSGSDPSELPFYPGNSNNIIYSVQVEVSINPTDLTQATFTTGGTYLATDIPANGFTLWYSTDENLTGGDVVLGALSSVTGSGESLIFTGFSQTFGIGTSYLFLTANIDPAAQIGNVISGQATQNSNFVFTGGASFAGGSFASANGHQIFGFPQMNELVFPQYMGSKSAASSNNSRTPVAYCVSIDNLYPNTLYDIKMSMALPTDAINLYGAGNLWTGTAFAGNEILSAFTTDANGSSGPVWIYLQPTGNSTRFDAGQTHQLRLSYRINGSGSFPGSPVFISTQTTTALDIPAAERTPEATDDGAFIKGIANAGFDGKYVLLFDNDAGNGLPLYAYQVRNTVATNSSQSEFPELINDVYLQAGTSVVGDFAAVVPIGANNPNGVRRIEFRNADNTLFDFRTTTDGIWGSEANTTTIGRRDVQVIDFFEPTNHATDFAAGTTTATTIPLTWTDAAGLILPDAYLIKGSAVSFGDIVEPVDGTPEANGALVQNLNFGDQAFTFTGLDPATTYYFKIYPYTNTGTTVNYKTGLETPEAMATTQSQAADKELNVLFFLEGPYNGTFMNIDLVTNNLLPNNQPYDGAPWNYAGTESVVTFPANVVDWVLVELRDASAPELAIPSTKLAGWPKAMFVRTDGQLIGLDGSLPNIGNPAVANNLYIVIRHRNHIDIMSATGLVLSGNTYSYDFTGSVNQAYGGSLGYKLLDGGACGMASGDMDADGKVFASDFVEWATDSGLGDIYSLGDLDFDGNVFASDFVLWAGNSGLDYPVETVQPDVPVFVAQVPDNE